MIVRRRTLYCILSILFLAPLQAQVQSSYGQLPLHFEKNLGQTDAAVEFVARGAGYTYFITGTETVAVLRKQEAATPDVVRMQLVGAKKTSQISGLEMLAGKSNHLIGNDPSQWRTNVPLFQKVKQSAVYDGIDVVYYGNQGQIEYDFVVRPGSDPRQIRMRFDGAERIDIDASGDLILHTRGGDLRQRLPIAYQQRGATRQPVQARYRRLGEYEFGFALGHYETTLPLVIDPILAWSTYLGGSSFDPALSITVDSAGNAYVVGQTSSINFPTANAIQAANAGSFDAFVTKINTAGTALVYSTYLGGSLVDTAFDCAVDSSGSVYLTGQTSSNNFPTLNPIQAAYGLAGDAFLVKLNAAGNALVYSTYLGGTGADRGHSIAVDSAFNAHVAGSTLSTNFPTANALQAGSDGNEAFVTKVNAAGTALIYSTYLGGILPDAALGVALDASGNTYVSGQTDSPNFPTANALQGAIGGGTDGFLTKINAAGSALIYSTYLGGSTADRAQSVAVDAAGNAYCVGSTDSTNFPTANALQPIFGGDYDAFVTKLNPAGNAFVYSTYLGGSSGDSVAAVAVNSSQQVFLAGETSSANFPIVRALQPAIGGAADAFVTGINASGTALVFSTFLGGSVNDLAYGIAIDNAGGTYVAGYTTSADFPTRNPIQAAPGGATDAFVAKLVPGSADLAVVKTASGAFVVGQNSTWLLNVANDGPDASQVTVTDILPAGAALVSATPTQGSCSGTMTVTCALGIINSAGSATITLVVTPLTPGPLSNTATVSGTADDPVAIDNTSTANVIVLGNADLSIVKTAAGPFVAGQNGTYTITVSNGGPNPATNAVVTDILPAGATFVSATPTQGSCSGTTTVTCNLGTINNAGTATITLVVMPVAPGPLSNTATVTTNDIDGSSLNNTSTTVVQVGAEAFAAVPMLDPRALFLLTALLAGVGIWMTWRTQ
jgi:uncharacterized repeat protein (TIGR01451 family)